MNLSEIFLELKKSGYTSNQILQYMVDMYGLHFHTSTIQRTLHEVREEPREIQNLGTRKWQVLAELCPREAFESYYNKKNKRYKKSELCKDYGISDPDFQTLYSIYKSRNKINCFSMATREDIFIADNYTCRACGGSDQKMYTKHILSNGGDCFSNGITMCYNCHATSRRNNPYSKDKKHGVTA